MVGCSRPSVLRFVDMPALGLGPSQHPICALTAIRSECAEVPLVRPTSRDPAARNFGSTFWTFQSWKNVSNVRRQMIVVPERFVKYGSFKILVVSCLEKQKTCSILKTLNPWLNGQINSVVETLDFTMTAVFFPPWRKWGLTHVSHPPSHSPTKWWFWVNKSRTRPPDTTRSCHKFNFQFPNGFRA